MTALISVRDLTVSYPDHGARRLFGPVPRKTILHGVTLELPKGRITGIVGESGSGKSTLGRALVRLVRPDAGQIIWAGGDRPVDLAPLDEAQLKPLRQDLQMIFQDPMSSLNPRQKIWQLIAWPLRRYGLDASRAAACAALERVHLGAAFADRFAHQLSGGQRQRVGIARAIALNPQFILADEIVSGLDVSSQATVLTLLQDLARDMNLTVAFISHDLSVIRHLCDDLIVLNHGRIVESGPVAQIFDAPSAAETRKLIAAVPLPKPDAEWLT
ncbi:ABC transporter ATP-binding protein [Phaeobacter sp. HF9A]|uniref:ABC transporter ATP-binding protein n=1 Tax=Phaeobacter sp. HF9A TaxID=2721561 RepID=UPI001431DC47|nr:dipeptide/oligopeptide/nickel ABC transporter ATP-binding protein [Phaeobacter sp. HF9A]NIZ11974.1 ABC transporter ATP-binding protein [Phaeobacter sp. HF9A]